MRPGELVNLRIGEEFMAHVQWKGNQISLTTSCRVSSANCSCVTTGVEM